MHPPRKSPQNRLTAPRSAAAYLFLAAMAGAPHLVSTAAHADKAPPAADKDKAVQIEATLCKKLKGDTPIDPTNKFTKDTEVIYGAWRSVDGKEGMPYRVVWIAEDVGKAAPPGTKIIEKKGVMSDKEIGKKATFWTGNISLSRPTNGWPVGRYRAELFFADRLVKTLRFTIE